MTILNFAHPLTPPQQTQIEAITSQPIHQLIDIPVAVDETQPLAPQVNRLIHTLDLTPHDWQSLPILINPPSYAPVTACVLAELHGRMGHFPAFIRIRPVADSLPRLYEVAEVVNLQAVREQARGKR